MMGNPGDELQDLTEDLVAGRPEEGVGAEEGLHEQLEPGREDLRQGLELALADFLSQFLEGARLERDPQRAQLVEDDSQRPDI